MTNEKINLRGKKESLLTLFSCPLTREMPKAKKKVSFDPVKFLKIILHINKNNGTITNTFTRDANSYLTLYSKPHNIHK